MYGKELEQDKYIVVQGILDDSVYRIAEHYYKIKFNTRHDFFVTIPIIEGEVVKPYAVKDYSDMFTESLLAELTPTMQEIVGKDLVPTYSYIRLYENGNYLVEHDDRDSCEYSVTLPMVTDGTPWEIYMGDTPVNLEIGQAVIYKGCEIVHRRNPYEGNMQIQAHLHWVENTERNKEFFLDGRSSLGLTVERFEKRKNINYA